MPVTAPAQTGEHRLTVAEVAARLRASKERVLRLIAAGKLRALNTGLGEKRPRWIVLQRDLEAFEAGRFNIAATTPQAPRRRPAAVPSYFAG
jgi:excisionase family DNA binding protein